jgi:hypothetical protein
MNWPPRGTRRQTSSGSCTFIRIRCANICGCPRLWPTTAARTPLLLNRSLAYLEVRWQQGEVMITTLWHELQAQGFTGRDISVWTCVRNWPLPAGMTPTSSSSSVAPSTRRGAPTTRTPRPGQRAVVASAGGSECKGCGLSTGIVRPFPTSFVSLGARSGLRSPDPGAQKPGLASLVGAGQSVSL